MTAKRHAGPLRNIAEAAGVLLSRHNLLVSFIASPKNFALVIFLNVNKVQFGAKMSTFWLENELWMLP